MSGHRGNCRHYSGYGLSQWEAKLQCNTISHCLNLCWNYTQSDPWTVLAGTALVTMVIIILYYFVTIINIVIVFKLIVVWLCIYPSMNCVICGWGNGLSSLWCQVVPNYYWLMDWETRNGILWNLNQNKNIFLQKIYFENNVCKIKAILSRPLCVVFNP